MIYGIGFSQDALPLVQGFDCGNGEVNAWIKGLPADGDCALKRMAEQNPKRRSDVWIYSSDAKVTQNSLVGYASLGLSAWPLTSGAKSQAIGMIPFFGVDLRFQGQFHEGDETFAKAVYDDLLEQAKILLPPEICHIGLYVDPANVKGVRFWTNTCDFEPLTHRTYPEGDVTYQGMLTKFR